VVSNSGPAVEVLFVDIINYKLKIHKTKTEAICIILDENFDTSIFKMLQLIFREK